MSCFQSCPPCAECEERGRRIRELEKALGDACDLAHEGWTYAPEYFQQKWSSAERLAACRAALAATKGGESNG